MKIKMTINRKLLVGYIVSAIFIAIIIIFSFSQLHKAEEKYDHLINHSSRILVDIKELEVLITKQSSDLRGYILNRDPEMFSGLQATLKEMPQLIEKLSQTITNDGQFERLNQLSQLNSEWNNKSEEVIELVQNNKLEEANRINNMDLMAISQKFRELSQEFAENQQVIVEAEQLSIEQEMKAMLTFIIIIGIIAIILSMIVGTLISKRISKRIASLNESTKLIAEGDLTGESLRFETGDEMGQLADSFNQMKDNLKGLIEQIGTSSEMLATSASKLLAGSEQVSIATGQVSITIQDMTDDTAKVALASEETAKGMEGIAIQFQQIVEAIGIVAEMSTVTANQAEHGNVAITNAIKQMDVIHLSVEDSSQIVSMLNQKTKEIEQMVGNITEITTQTELLSLNAAIEAAHAGEHGKGFAVVANEIKKLAEHSQDSSKQIVKLVNDIRKDTEKISKGMEKERLEVHSGVEVIREASRAFHTIMESVQHVTNQTQEVSASSEEVSAVTEEVTASVESISSHTKESANDSANIAAIAEEQLASMQEITEFAANLSELAVELQSKITKFKV